jgi:hypothetical protein
MMHGHEKSDLAIVVMNPVNKAEDCRYTPEVGAVCGKVARPDLCGGREVTRVPTASASFAALPSRSGVGTARTAPGLVLLAAFWG